MDFKPIEHSYRIYGAYVLYTVANYAVNQKVPFLFEK